MPTESQLFCAVPLTCDSRVCFTVLNHWSSVRARMNFGAESELSESPRGLSQRPNEIQTHELVDCRVHDDMFRHVSA